MGSVTVVAVSVLFGRPLPFRCFLQSCPVKLIPRWHLDGRRGRRRVRRLIGRVFMLALGEPLYNHSRIELEHRIVLENFPVFMLPDRPPKFLLVALLEKEGF